MAIHQREVSALHTITASETTNQFIEMSYAAALPFVFVRVQFFDVLLASESGTLTFTAKVSYDKGRNWSTNRTGDTISLSTTVQSGEQTFQVTPQSLPPDSGVVWVMILATIAGSPTGATATYRADLV